MDEVEVKQAESEFGILDGWTRGMSGKLVKYSLGDRVVTTMLGNSTLGIHLGLEAIGRQTGKSMTVMHTLESVMAQEGLDNIIGRVDIRDKESLELLVVAFRGIADELEKQIDKFKDDLLCKR